ncbi:polysaccharide biosynthesis/export family protein [Myxosarcina sp. GI1]|uniref:polysaccharide biosynthesis/export family protein n=1 Tax=Myxosarcina sp. GI1 TaxID=1541065 RepID=UPI00055BA777|nr:SLBB domain-containing protein [Myxosarcina sp. GI1]
MNLKFAWYKLFLTKVNRVGAIALILALTTASLPALAQENDSLENDTLELQDPDSLDDSSTPERLPIGDFSKPLPRLNSDESSPVDGPVLPATASDSSEFATEETAYTLGAGDRIALNIFQVEEYSGEYPVAVDGTINLPLVGGVNVSGLTLAETSDAVSKKYATYLKRPIVTVGLIAPRPLKIAVSGEVDNPGSYEVPLTGENQKFPTVTDMIEQAGGINTIADVRNVRVQRTIKDKEVVFNANLWDLLTKGAIRQDISLRDGDTVFVPTTDEISTSELARLSQASFGLQVDEPISVAVVGEVYRPGSHTVEPEQLTSGNNNLNDVKPSLPPRLTQAIGAAQGIKPLADVREVAIYRKAWDGSEKLIAVNLWELIQSGDTSQDVILQEGDRIVIPQAEAIAKEDIDLIATASYARDTITVNVVGEVTSPGAQQVQPNTPLNQAILAAGGFDNQRADTSDVELVRLQPNGTVDKREIKVDLSSGIDDETNPTLRHNDVVVVNRSGVTKGTDAAGKILSPIGGALGIIRLFFGF